MHSVTAHLGHDRLFVSGVCDNVSGRCHGPRTDLAPLPDCRGRPERGVPRCGQREGRRSGAGRTAEELPGHRAQAEAGKSVPSSSGQLAKMYVSLPDAGERS